MNILILFLAISSANYCPSDGKIVEQPKDEQSQIIIVPKDLNKSYSVYWINKDKENMRTILVCSLHTKKDTQWSFVSDDYLTGAEVPIEVINNGGYCNFVHYRETSRHIEYYLCECPCRRQCRCSIIESVFDLGE